MTPQEFCYWLQGFLEISNARKIDADQLTIIKDHLQLVFKKETPNRVNFREFTGPIMGWNDGIALNNERLCSYSDVPMGSC